MNDTPLPLSGTRVLAFVGDIYEDLELLYPRLRLIEAGAEVVCAGLDDAGTLYTGKHGYPIRSDACLDEVDDQAFDALLIPGGFMPDKLRRNEAVRRLTRAFHEDGRPVDPHQRGRRARADGHEHAGDPGRPRERGRDLGGRGGGRLPQSCDRAPTRRPAGLLPGADRDDHRASRGRVSAEKRPRRPG